MFFRVKYVREGEFLVTVSSSMLENGVEYRRCSDIDNYMLENYTYQQLKRYDVEDDQGNHVYTFIR